MWFRKRAEQGSDKRSGHREGQKYQAIMTNAGTLLSGAEKPTQKVAILQYVITVLGRELAAETNARLLCGQEVPHNDSLHFPDPEGGYSQQRLSDGTAKYHALADLNVLCCPWDIGRMGSAAYHIFQDGFLHRNENYDGVFYPEVRLVVVRNGRHHLAAATAINTGCAKLDICSLKEDFPTITTDGDYWYRSGQRLYEVFDYRMAAMYELARMINEISVSQNVQAPAHVLEEIETPRYESELLMKRNNEIFILKQDCNILLAQVARLKEENEALKAALEKNSQK